MPPRRFERWPVKPRLMWFRSDGPRPNDASYAKYDSPYGPYANSAAKSPADSSRTSRTDPKWSCVKYRYVPSELDVPIASAQPAHHRLDHPAMLLGQYIEPGTVVVTPCR